MDAVHPSKTLQLDYLFIIRIGNTNHLQKRVDIMKKCEKCKTFIKENEGREFQSKIWCEDCYDDCYIDELMPKMQKSYYNNDAEFMQRLKDSYPARKQQYH
jgi:hypothetical protein